MRQISLLPAGAQPWNCDIVAVKGNRFAYCATLAIYIYEYDSNHREFRLHSIVAEHKKTVLAIDWHCHDPDLIASAGYDMKLIIWHVSKQMVVAQLENVPHLPQSIQWSPRSDDVINFCSRLGPLVSWKFNSINKKDRTETIIHSHSVHSEINRFRINPKNADRIAFGHKNGTLSLITMGTSPERHIITPDNDNSPKHDILPENPCLGLEWDPRSIDYLLVANQYSGIRLVDFVSKSVITRFKMPTSAVETQAISWIPSGPGAFVSGDGKAAILRLWNASKETPLENVKLRKAGFQALVCFATPDDEEMDVDMLLEQSQRGSYFAKFPARILCTFNDGGVGLYNLRLRKWEFLRDLGHVETIFDCKFSYDNPDHLATASFDGTIKVWDVKTWTAVANSGGNEGIIYSISWSPGEESYRLIAATSKNGSFIWDMKSCKVIKRFHNLHNPGKAVFCVAWNPRDPKEIASCSADKYCIVHTPDGEIITKFHHPSAVFGCDWNPSSRDMLATACEDGKIRVYYVVPSVKPSSTPSPSEKPIRVFSGHTAKVFSVKWSPLKDGAFASVSDDKTVRIWDYSCEYPLLALEGHSSPTRGLAWSSEIPWLLISGSWDASLKCWDVRHGGKCIASVKDHGADIYGLAVHPNRPFVLASTSRDSTVRLWSLAWLAESAFLPAIADRPLTETFGDDQKKSPIETTEQHQPKPKSSSEVLLCGHRSRSIRNDYETASYQRANPKMLKENFLKDLTLLFGPPGVTLNLWSLVQVFVGVDDTLLPSDYRHGVVDLSHMLKYHQSEALRLERSQNLNASGRTQSAQRISQVKDEKLREAADLHIQCGNIFKYCEILIQLGEWEKAIAVAPGVSNEYWKDVSQRHISILLKNGDVSSAMPYAISAGLYEEILSSLLQSHRTNEGLLLSQIAKERLGQPSQSVATEKVEPSNSSQLSSNILDLQQHFTDQQASTFLRNGSPISSACCYMAAHQPIKSLCVLVRGYELELTVAVGKYLLGKSLTNRQIEEMQPRINKIICYSIELLAMRCLNFKNWALAIDLLTVFGCSKDSVERICSMSLHLLPQDMPASDFLKRARLPSFEESFKQANNETSAVIDRIRNFLLSTSPMAGINLGLEHVMKVMSTDNWTASDVFEVLYTMGTIRTDALQNHDNLNTKNALLALSAYVGAFMAMRRLYLTIVIPLFDCCSNVLKKGIQPINGIDLPIDEKTIQTEKSVWIHHMMKAKQGKSMDPNYANLMRKAGSESIEEFPIGVGIFSTTGSNLPSHFETHRCYFSGLPIRGIPYRLEDGSSVISHCDALMWAIVNRFSPLNTGLRINPF